MSIPLTHEQAANGLSAMDPRDDKGQRRPQAQEIIDATVALLKADKRAMRAVHDALAKVWGDPEDCDDCAARADDDGEPCAIHGDRSTALYHAIQDVLELIGPCACGHPKSQHEDVDSTHCKTCDCVRFDLPAEARS